MKFPAFEKTNMLTPAPGERLTGSPAVVLAIFFLVMTVAQSGRSVIFSAVEAILADRMNYRTALIIELFATLSTVAAVLLYCLLAEKRSLSSLGFTKRGAFAEYGIGLVGGFLMLGGAVLLCAVCGTVTVGVTSPAPSLGIMALFLLGFLIQGMSEEMLCRSYLMVSLARGWPVWVCAVLNSLIFSLLHLGNSNVSVIALVNIFLFGLFASLLTLRRGSIWMVGALHSMWNFAQGNLFGIPVSGIRGTPSPLSTDPAAGTWQELVNGGAFGLEGGLAVTLVLAAACAIALFMPTKKAEIADKTNDQ